jgi:serine/threonine-protein kinase RsbW
MTTKKFPGRYDSLEKISQFVTQIAREAGFNGKDVYGVELAVDEACTNIIEHGYKGEDVGEIECTCEVTPRGLTVILKDEAPPFDPDRVSDPKIKVPLKKLKPRGLGVFFMRKMMDEVTFQFSPAGNILTMVKKRK